MTPLFDQKQNTEETTEDVKVSLFSKEIKNRLKGVQGFAKKFVCI